MSETHTDSPWEIEKDDPGDGVYIVGSDGETIAIMSRDIMCDETIMANAKLMAASPELLEALDGIISIGKRDMSNPKYDGYFEFAREVLAKAKKGG